MRQKQPKSSSDIPQKMANFKKVIAFLKQFPGLIAFPSGFSFIGLEEIIEPHILCLCTVGDNKLTWSLITGPPFAIFILMYYFLRPFTNRCFCCSAEANDKQDCFIAFIYCLIPPVMWAIILLLDGDYFVCYMTDWNGVYVFDEQLNRLWCKPTEGMRNETELRYLIKNYVHQSQCIGCIIMTFSSILLFFIICIYDCIKAGKCKRCKNTKQQSSCCGQTIEKQREGQGQEQRERSRVYSASI